MVNNSSSSKSIKTIANIFFIIGLIVTLVGGVVLIVSGLSNQNYVSSAVGIAIATIGSWLVYVITRILDGFGELIGNTDRIARDLHQLCRAQSKRNATEAKYDQYDDRYDEYDVVD